MRRPWFKFQSYTRTLRGGGAQTLTSSASSPAARRRPWTSAASSARRPRRPRRRTCACTRCSSCSGSCRRSCVPMTLQAQPTKPFGSQPSNEYLSLRYSAVANASAGDAVHSKIFFAQYMRLCGNQSFTARSSTPSTRRLLDGVAMPVPHRSTECTRRILPCRTSWRCAAFQTSSAASAFSSASRPYTCSRASDACNSNESRAQAAAPSSES